MTVRSQPAGILRRLGPLLLMPASEFAVHQLRYFLAFGARAGAELQAQGHSYLHSAVPWIMLLMALAVGVFLRSLGGAFRGQCSLPRYSLSLAGLWLVCSGALVMLFASQEFLEGLFATGHPAGLVGIFGYGGWWAIPAALAVGLVLAAVFHGARWLLHEVAVWSRRRVAPAPRRTAARRLPRAALLAVPAPLAGGWSGRGPPR